MNQSPFAAFVNATLRFSVNNGAMVTDALGNVRPGQSAIEVQAVLNEARSPIREPRPGVDSTAIWVEGWVVDSGQQDPLTLPGIITPDSPCQAVWNGYGGQFYLGPVVRSAWGVEVATGDELRGWFQVGSFVPADVAPWVPVAPSLPGAGGQFVVGTASIDLLPLRIVATNNQGLLIYADSNNPALAYRVLGLNTAAIAAGNTVQILTDGSFLSPNWNWLSGLPLFVGLNGLLTQTPPVTGFLLQVGTVINPQLIDLELQPPTLLD